MLLNIPFEKSRKSGMTEIEWDTSLLTYAYDVSLQEDDTECIKRNMGTLVTASKKSGL
jgi:hypothetical protein